MRAVVTRVKSASVKIDGNVNGAIGQGFLVFLGNYVLTYLPIWCIIKTSNEKGVYIMELTYTDTIYDFQGLYDNLWECEHVLETIEDADKEEEAYAGNDKRAALRHMADH